MLKSVVYVIHDQSHDIEETKINQLEKGNRIYLEKNLQMGHHGAETQVYLPVMVNLNSLKREVTKFGKNA